MELRNLIGGRACAALDGETLDVHEPATGRVFARCPASNARDVDAAVAAARHAARDWAASP
ncbi:MAG: aldehyde dehydrogenase family protein, partial [Xanthomonadales bacterium]|nr:aldehyde dehydrogenase family protein [Xanthomonadales bacterium]